MIDNDVINGNGGPPMLNRHSIGY